MVWAGVDVGGRRKGFHAVVVDDAGVAAGPLCIPSVEHCIAWLLAHGPALVAVDSPRTPAPDGCHLRECELRLHAEVCGIRWTPSRAALDANRAYYGWILHGLELYVALATAGVDAVECFPTASWTRWLGPRSGTRAAWTRAGLARLGLTGVPARTNQDTRDDRGRRDRTPARCRTNR